MFSHFFYFRCHFLGGKWWGKRYKICPVMAKHVMWQNPKKINWATHTLAGSIDYVTISLLWLSEFQCPSLTLWLTMSTILAILAQCRHKIKTQNPLGVLFNVFISNICIMLQSELLQMLLLPKISQVLNRMNILATSVLLLLSYLLPNGLCGNDDLSWSGTWITSMGLRAAC